MLKQADPTPRSSFLHILGVFLRLGVTSFGDPIAHLGGSVRFRASLPSSG
jgi:chromate transport protein ChrA